MTMSMVQPLNKGAVELTINVKDFFVQTFNLIKDKIVSLAKIVFAFAKDTVWPLIKNAAVQTWTFIRTPAGFITVGGTLGIGLAFLSTRVNGDEQPILKGALQVASVAAFIGTGIVIGLGIAKGFTAVLI